MLYYTIVHYPHLLAIVILVVPSLGLFQFLFINAFVGFTGIVSMKDLGRDFHLCIRL